MKPSVNEDQVANVLEMKALHRLSGDYERVQSYSDENGHFIASQINAAEILQRFLEERNYTGDLADFNDWKEMLESVLGDEECGDAIGSDERSIANAAFASSALLHEDLDYSRFALAGKRYGNPTPSLAYTLANRDWGGRGCGG